MSGERIEIEIEPVTGKEREATRSQALSEGVDEKMSHGLCSRTKLKHQKNLGERINGQPQPQHLLVAAQPRSQFVQLEVGDLQGVEATLVQGLCMFSCADEP